MSERVGSVSVCARRCCACLRVCWSFFLSVRDPVRFPCVYMMPRVLVCRGPSVFPRVGWKLWVCPVCVMVTRYIQRCWGGCLSGGGWRDSRGLLLRCWLARFVATATPVTWSPNPNVRAFFPSRPEAPDRCVRTGPRPPPPPPLGTRPLLLSTPCFSGHHLNSTKRPPSLPTPPAPPAPPALPPPQVQSNPDKSNYS